MKTLLIALTVVLISVRVNSQVTGRTGTRTKTSSPNAARANAPNQTTANKAGSTSHQTRTTPQGTQSITEQRLNGPAGTTTTGSSAKTPANETPFANGVHAADNAAKTFDSLNTNANTIHRNTQTGVNVAAANDTTFNVNTARQNSVNTNAGAVDRSGQSQFGQTNWGRNARNTVGESQWTVPPPITSTFNKEFPAANSATWTRNNVDTTIYSARYKSGESWVTSRYNAAGERIDTRFEVPMVQAPRPVSVYLAKQPSNFRITSISRLQIEGKPEVFEIITAAGKTIYINNDGMETKL
jgi:hypothetical protein